MLATQFRLRSLMIWVALIAVGLWIAITISRFWATISMLQGEAAVVLSPAHVILAAGIIVSLSLMGFGFIGLAMRLRAVLRATSNRTGRTRPDR